MKNIQDAGIPLANDGPSASMNQEHPSSKGCRILAMLLCLQVIRAVLTTLTAPGAYLGPDGAWYADMARVVREKGIFHPDAFAAGYMPPLWPIVVASWWSITGESLVSIRVLNLIFWLIAVAATFEMVRTRSGTGTALLAALGFALHEVFYFAQYVQYEVLLTALSVLALWSWLGAMARRRMRDFALSGVLWGLAALVQTRVLPVVALLPLAAWSIGEQDRKRARGAALCIAVCASVLFPYAVRNWMALGRWTIASGNFGVNLLIGNNPGATGRYMDPSSQGGPDTTGLRGAYAVDEARAAWAAHWIKENPGTVLFKLVPLKMYYLWRLDKVANWLLIAPVVLGLVGLWKRGSRLETSSFACVLLYVSVVHAVFFGEGRFRFWVLPFFHACVAEFASKLLPRDRARSDVSSQAG